MGELEEKLNSVLNNPALMQQIMNMAQNMNPPEGPNQEPQERSEILPDIDMNMIKKLSGFAQRGSIDQHQKSLLSALRPYLSQERIKKLEKAMRAARMAQVASGMLGAAQFQSGR